MENFHIAQNFSAPKVPCHTDANTQYKNKRSQIDRKDYRSASGFCLRNFSLLIEAVFAFHAISGGITSLHVKNETASDLIANDVLTMAEIADILRCSNPHVANLINGKVPGVPILTHVPMGRRKVVRRPWLVAWMEASKREC